MAPSGWVVLIPGDDEGLLRSLEIEENSIAALVDRDEDPINVIRSLLVREPFLVYLHHVPSQGQPNIRASRLAMACGHLAMRLTGSVVVSSSSQCDDDDVEDAVRVATTSADLRRCILAELNCPTSIPQWLSNASRSNYHDDAVLNRLAQLFRHSKSTRDDDERDEAQTAKALEPVVSHTEFVACSPLCLHCRRKASTLCDGCHGVYFCNDQCRRDGYVKL